MKVKLVTLDGCERFMDLENPVRVIEVPILLGTHHTFGDVLDIDGPTAFIRRYEYHHTDRVRPPDPASSFFDPDTVLMVYVESSPYLQAREPRVETSEPITMNKRQLREGE